MTAIEWKDIDEMDIEKLEKAVAAMSDEELEVLLLEPGTDTHNIYGERVYWWDRYPVWIRFQNRWYRRWRSLKVRVTAAWRCLRGLPLPWQYSYQCDSESTIEPPPWEDPDD